MIKSTYLNNYWIYKERHAKTAVPLLWQITVICVLCDNESSLTPALTAFHKMICRYHRDIVMCTYSQQLVLWRWPQSLMASNNTHITASDCINANVISLFSTVSVLHISTYSYPCIHYGVTNVYEHVSVIWCFSDRAP